MHAGSVLLRYPRTPQTTPPPPRANRMSRLVRTRYGHFSPDGREYVITRPDTPKPW